MEKYIEEFADFVQHREVHTSEMMGDATLRVYKIETKVDRHGNEIWYAICRDVRFSPLSLLGEVHIAIEKDWREMWVQGKSGKYGEELYTLGCTTSVLLAKSQTFDWREVENTNHDLRSFIVWWNDKSIETAQVIEARSPQDAIRFCHLDDMDFYNEVPEKTEYYAREVL